MGSNWVGRKKPAEEMPKGRIIQGRKRYVSLGKRTKIDDEYDVR